MAKFNPEWDIVYLHKGGDYQYCVIKKPEPIPGEKELMVREGCTVLSDGRWWYWRLRQPMDYRAWKKAYDWDDAMCETPDFVVSARLNRGKPGSIPAPVFKNREDNNWIGADPREVPNHLTDEMLGDLTLAHLQLCDELREGKPLKAQA